MDQIAPIDNAHPGLIASPTTTLTSGNRYFSARLGRSASQGPTVSFSLGTVILGGGSLSINWVAKINNLSTNTDSYLLYFGLVGAGDYFSTITDGVFFKYSNNINSGNWTLNTMASSVSTTINTFSAADTSWHNFGITINAAASSVSFTMDGVSAGSAITTNIPTLPITPFFLQQWGAGTVPVNSLYVDLFYMTQTLTTPR